jgi:hypothetical protein
MPIVAADLQKYQSANHPKADTGTSGGAIAATKYLDQLVLAANDQTEAVSDNAGDTTQTITIVGRDAAGAIQTEGPVTLNGTTPVALGTTTYERILQVTKSAATTGTVTIRRDAAAGDICTMPPAILDQIVMFYDAASEASIAIRYEKEYWQNNHGTLTLNSATVTLTDDPAGGTGRCRIALETSADQSTTNRKTVPGGSPTWVDDDVAVDITSLAAGANVGIWVEQNLPADDPAFKSTYTTELAGTTV